MDLIVKTVDRDYYSRNILHDLRTLQIIEIEEGKLKVYVNGNESIEINDVKDLGVTFWKS